MSPVLYGSAGIDHRLQSAENALQHGAKFKIMKREFSVLADLTSNMSENFDI